MVERVWGFIAAWLWGVLFNFANEIWDALWAEVFEAIEEAEREWESSGKGTFKRDHVVKKVMKFIEEKSGEKFGWIERMVSRAFVGRVVDAIVKGFNKSLGDNWVSKAKEIEEKLSGLIPGID